MRLSEIVKNPSSIKPENLWLWHPVLADCLPWVKSQGLTNPFLFGKRRSANSLRLPKDRVILRIAKRRLDTWRLKQDFSIREAIFSCEEGCWWSGPLRAWLQSMPLKETDIITRWASGQDMPNKDDQNLVVKQLRRLEDPGLWKYCGVITPEHISILDSSANYYVSLDAI